MRSITSYDFRSIASNQRVMLAWYVRRVVRRLVRWVRVGLFVPSYLTVVLSLFLLFVFNELAWNVLLPKEYRHKRDEFFPENHS